MSSTVSTVRSAVLKGVFSGTRSMPKRMSVIFMDADDRRMLVMWSTSGSLLSNRSGVSGVTDTPFSGTRVTLPSLSR